jgi:hypothetical protein
METVSTSVELMLTILSPRRVLQEKPHNKYTSTIKNVHITTDYSMLNSIHMSRKANRRAILETELHSSGEQTFQYMNHTEVQNLSGPRVRKYPSKRLLKTLSLMTSMPYTNLFHYF